MNSMLKRLLKASHTLELAKRIYWGLSYNAWDETTRAVAQVLSKADLVPRQETAPRPVSSLIEINNNCNLNCVMCNTKLSSRPTGYMDRELFARILELLSQIGVKAPGLHTVGEPFVHPDLPGLLEVAQQKHYPVHLSTNAQFSKRISSILGPYGGIIDHLRFSIDAAFPDTYQAIRRGGTFDKVLASLEVVKKYNETASKPILLKCNFVVSHLNHREIGDFLKLMLKYTALENIKFSLVDGLTPDSSYFHEQFPFPNLVRHAVPCRMVFRNVYFTHDGKLTLCCRDYEEELVVGDILGSNIMDNWLNPVSQDIREQHSDPDRLKIQSCLHCHVPYRFANSLANLYVHQLWKTGCEPQEIGPRLWLFLAALNQNISDRKGLKKQTLQFFRGDR